MNSDKRELRLRNDVHELVGKLEGTRGDGFSHQLAQPGLAKRNSATTKGCQPWPVRLDANDRVTQLSQADCRHQADVPGSDDTNTRSILPIVRTWFEEYRVRAVPVNLVH